MVFLWISTYVSVCIIVQYYKLLLLVLVCSEKTKDRFNFKMSSFNQQGTNYSATDYISYIYY